METSTSFPLLEHGRVYSLRLSDFTVVPLMAWRTHQAFPWQMLDTCVEDEICTHSCHSHLEARPDGTLVGLDGVEPGPHDLDVRAVVEGLTVHDLRPANHLALARFRKVIGPCYPCRRCEATIGSRHHPQCFAGNLVPLFPIFIFGRDTWQDALTP